MSGVVVDIALDYALSRDWRYYFTEDRFELFDQLYNRMERAAPSIGERAVTFVGSMRARNWFKSYGEFDGIQRVFNRLATRNRFLNSIIGAETEVENCIDQYTQIMRKLYPKVEGELLKL